MALLTLGKPKDKNLPDASWVVFNTTAQDRAFATKHFIEKYGREAFERLILPGIKDGIMGIFRTKQNNQRTYYVNLLVESFELRQKRDAKSPTT